MKKLGFLSIITVLLASVIATSALADSYSPDDISAFSITPSSVYPGEQIVFRVEWFGTSGLSEGDGHALCFYYNQNFNNSIGLTIDGFTAAGDVNSEGSGDEHNIYMKEGPANGDVGTTSCPIDLEYNYVVGYVATWENGGVSFEHDSINIPIIVPREAANQIFNLLQRRYPEGGSAWEDLQSDIFASASIIPAASIVYAGTTEQCESNVPCYPTIQ